MSYHHRSMGQVASLLATARVAPGTKIPKCPPGMYEGGFAWVPPAAGRAGYWRRAKVGECGSGPPDGMKKTVHKGAGLAETFIARGGKWISQGIKKSPARVACEKAQIPAPFLPRCVELRGQGISMEAIIEQLIKEAEAAGVPVTPGAPAAAPRRRFPWLLIAGGLGAAGLVIYLRKRRRR